MDPNNGTPMLISGEQQLVLSAEDAAQLLAQAGIQLGDNEQVIIGDVGAHDQTDDPSGAGTNQSDVGIVADDASALVDEGLQPNILGEIAQGDHAGITAGGDGVVPDDGQVLYIDPNDPHAAEILQQAGLRLAEDGTVTSLATSLPVSSTPTTVTKSESVKSPGLLLGGIESPLASPSAASGTVASPSNLDLALPASPVKQPAKKSTSAKQQQQQQQQATTSAGKQIVQVGPDQQQVMYTVTGEDGKTQQYMMLCPKDMDQNLLIQTLVKQISADPANKGGKKTIKITQQRGALQKITGLPPGSRVVSQTITPSKSQRASAANSAASSSQAQASPAQQPQAKKVQKSPVKANSSIRRARLQQLGSNLPPPPPPPTTSAPPPPVSLPMTTINNDLFSSMTPVSQASLKNVLNHSEVFESVVPDLPFEPPDGGTRVYVKCNYCTSFRSTLNGDTWEAILNHILPVAKEEIQTTFYGDLGKHFIRSLRIQVNGKQLVSKGMREIPQCEVVLSHSLICRKTRREFIVCNPDAQFVANLAKHINQIQPGNSGRGNSLLCIFCNSPFTVEDYLRHIQPHLEAILATLNCFAGAYCANLYNSAIKAQRHCYICQDNESADLRFLPCTKFSNDYSCTKKLQFAVDCFREHYGDSGFLRLNTSTVARCSVCKNSQSVYCAVFHISTQIVGEDGENQQDVDTQLAVCINCQKQFINIVMKEQGFEERLKLFQLKNMEQLCSVLRVILNQASSLCEQKKTLIYTVHENAINPNAAVHMLQSAEVTQQQPVTKLMALAETDIVSSKTRAYFICDMCLFTVDLTSMLVAENDKQKNEMLLAIVLEHLVPHTESLMNVIASTATNLTFSLKYDLLCRVQDMKTFRKVIISLQKKFKAHLSNLEVQLEKDVDKTVSQLRNGVKAERRNIVQLKQLKSGPSPGSTIVGDSSTASQLIEVNKFIEKQKCKMGILSQTGCNTTLLGSYTECRLCSKFSFPDFRLLAGAAIQQASQSGESPKSIQLCENCVETVLTLCLPTEPECLQEAEECLALGEHKLMGHRLVLSNNMKKWLSLDGVNLIKRTVDEFDDSKHFDCSNTYLEALKRHICAVLKTCQRDEDITSCAAGFCITNTFLAKGKESNETAAALASLEQQIGVPIKQKRDLKPNEIQVTVLARKDKNEANSTTPAKSTGPTIVYPRGYQKKSGGVVTTTQKAANGKIIVGAAEATGTSASSSNEESVSAIQSFIDATSGEKSEVKLPAGIKITPAGKGTVNIKAVSEAATNSPNSTPKTTRAVAKRKASGSATSTPVVSDESETSKKASATKTTTKAMPGVSMVTLTANGVVTKVQDTNADVDDDEGDSEDDTLTSPSRKAGGKKDANKSNNEDSSADETPTRSKRQRREKKIFDL